MDSRTNIRCAALFIGKRVDALHTLSRISTRRASMANLFAVTIRDNAGLHLVARLARRSTGIYYLMPRDQAALGVESLNNWDPHASYHSDGTHHVKSYGARRLKSVKRQPLGDGFTGAEPLFAESFQPGELDGLPLLKNASAFTEVLEIPRSLVDSAEHHALAVDLLAPGATRLSGPWVKSVLEHSFRDAVPWIHATFWVGVA